MRINELPVYALWTIVRSFFKITRWKIRRSNVTMPVITSNNVSTHLCAKFNFMYSSIIKLIYFLFLDGGNLCNWIVRFCDFLPENESTIARPDAIVAKKNPMNGISFGLIKACPNNNGCVKNKSITMKDEWNLTKFEQIK